MDAIVPAAPSSVHIVERRSVQRHNTIGLSADAALRPPPGRHPADISGRHQADTPDPENALTVPPGDVPAGRRR